MVNAAAQFLRAPPLPPVSKQEAARGLWYVFEIFVLFSLLPFWFRLFLTLFLHCMS